MRTVSCGPGHLGEAAKLLERTLELDVEYEGVGAALKSVRFWVERQQRMEESRRAPTGPAICWTSGPHSRLAARIGNLPERCYQDIKHYIHATVVAYLLQTSTAETSAAANAGYTRPSAQTQRLLLLGHSFKAMGDFANAIRYLEHARRLARDWAPLLAELADCYSLIEDRVPPRSSFARHFSSEQQKYR